MTATSLAHALEYVTTDEIVKVRAIALGEQIRKVSESIEDMRKAAFPSPAHACHCAFHSTQEDGVANAKQAIYRDLEYAKSLIKRDTRLAPQHGNTAEAKTVTSTDMTVSPVQSPSIAAGSSLLSGRDGPMSDWDMMSERASTGPYLSDRESSDEDHRPRASRTASRSNRSSRRASLSSPDPAHQVMSAVGDVESRGTPSPSFALDSQAKDKKVGPRHGMSLPFKHILPHSLAPRSKSTNDSTDH
jgi:hypothetical protein